MDTFERLLRGAAVIDQVAFEAALVKMYGEAPHKPTSEYVCCKHARITPLRLG